MVNDRPAAGLDQTDSAEWICGVDEAGRGCLAGPIYAAAVVLDPRRPVVGVADSKTLTPNVRFSLETEIKSRALAFGIGFATVAEIDRRGIEWSNKIVFTRAVRDLLKRFPRVDPDSLLVRIDGNRRAIRLGLKQETITGGDRTEPSISAASILAKTARDRWVVETLHRRFPQYGFDRHKGYATRAHAEAIAKWGLTSAHRMSFKLHRAAEGRVEVNP